MSKLYDDSDTEDSSNYEMLKVTKSKKLYDDDSDMEDDKKLKSQHNIKEETKETSTPSKPALFIPQQINTAIKRVAPPKKSHIPFKKSTPQIFKPDTPNGDFIEKNKEIRAKVRELIKSNNISDAIGVPEERITYFMGKKIINEYDPYNWNRYEDVVKMKAQEKLAELEKAQKSVPEAKTTVTIKNVSEVVKQEEVFEEPEPPVKSSKSKMGGVDVALRYIQSKGHVPGTGLGKYNQGTTESIEIVKSLDGTAILKQN
uniref:G-patch domain-containing protein n=1 Tax=Strongyloides stercoralis TaxID=6248 RepID=A0A0K0ERE0_STRER